MPSRIPVIAACLSTIALTGCVTPEQREANRLDIFTDLAARHSTCETAKLLVPATDTTDRLSVEHQLIMVRKLNFPIVIPSAAGPCSDPKIQAYTVGYHGEHSGKSYMLGSFYARHMTRAEAELDPNISCRETYTSIYQPPVRLNGAGRVIQVPAGYKCTPTG